MQTALCSKILVIHIWISLPILNLSHLLALYATAYSTPPAYRICWQDPNITLWSGFAWLALPLTFSSAFFITTLTLYFMPSSFTPALGEGRFRQEHAVGIHDHLMLTFQLSSFENSFSEGSGGCLFWKLFDLWAYSY